MIPEAGKGDSCLIQTSQQPVGVLLACIDVLHGIIAAAKEPSLQRVRAVCARRCCC